MLSDQDNLFKSQNFRHQVGSRCMKSRAIIRGLNRLVETHATMEEVQADAFASCNRRGVWRAVESVRSSGRDARAWSGSQRAAVRTDLDWRAREEPVPGIR